MRRVHGSRNSPNQRAGHAPGGGIGSAQRVGRTGLSLSRRNLLLGAGGAATAAGLAACASGGESSVPLSSESGNALIAAFPQSAPHIPVGIPTRLPFMISDAEGVPYETLDGEVGFAVVKDGQEVASEVVAPRSEGIPRAYLPLNVQLDEAGIYDVIATYQGNPIESRFEVFAPEEVESPVVGQQLPPAFTATNLNPGLIDPMCTLVPQCPFHEVNLQDATGTGTRIALLVATPAFCQTAFCGPTLGNLVDLASDREDLIVIHSEVYQRPKLESSDLSAAQLAPVPDAYGLAIEPVLYVTDARSTITARADALIDRSEMEELLA
ncbi:MAG: hypothetical protein ACR2OH_09900 [Microthrixaceae bacterium]